MVDLSAVIQILQNFVWMKYDVRRKVWYKKTKCLKACRKY